MQVLPLSALTDGGNNMRLFIALLPDENTRSRLFSCAVRAAGGRAVKRDNLHMTLVFIGETERIREIKSAMESVVFSPVSVKIDRYGCFGSGSRRLLWAGGEADKKLSELYAELRNELSVRGIETEQRRLIPHITLCRNFSGEMPAQPPDIWLSSSKISLMQSVNVDGSVVYKELYSVGAFK